MDWNKIQQMIKEAITQASNFRTVKRGDTPTDKNQLTPKGYVDTQISSVYSAIPSASGGVFGGQVLSNVAGGFFPAGWTLTHIGTGEYTVTHNLGTGNYAVAVYPSFAGEAFCISGWAAIGTNAFEVWFNNPDASFVFQDSDFHFILTTN